MARVATLRGGAAHSIAPEVGLAVGVGSCADSGLFRSSDQQGYQLSHAASTSSFTMTLSNSSRPPVRPSRSRAAAPSPRRLSVPRPVSRETNSSQLGGPGTRAAPPASPRARPAHRRGPPRPAPADRCRAPCAPGGRGSRTLQPTVDLGPFEQFTGFDHPRRTRRGRRTSSPCRPPRPGVGRASSRTR